jgi:uncharacterized membrane protein YeaQ/YmgE (transglycosylase-associated protein family)
MGFLAWIVVGLIAGWLAGQVMAGGGYGTVADIILGILGGLLGGWIFGAIGIWPAGGMIGSIIVDESALVGAGGAKDFSKRLPSLTSRQHSGWSGCRTARPAPIGLACGRGHSAR